ncbi:hypothetical protein SAMN02910429_00525 [Lachnobacterium bovis]|uniref:Uncharacterized protein n=1 Tax=Lachnobacterium bovis TaxID=140626 RepID=A0A1H9QFW3_9FIRM|nr:hypothetical protein SAMN02910429_00525 [Lachnobacterium bovis]
MERVYRHFDVGILVLYVNCTNFLKKRRKNGLKTENVLCKFIFFWYNNKCISRDGI